MTKIEEFLENTDALFDEHLNVVSIHKDDIVAVCKDYAEWYAKQCLEIAAQHAESCFWTVLSDGEEHLVSKLELLGDDYKYSDTFDSLPIISANQDTILNIKLPEHE